MRIGGGGGQGGARTLSCGAGQPLRPMKVMSSTWSLSRSGRGEGMPARWMRCRFFTSLSAHSRISLRVSRVCSRCPWYRKSPCRAQQPGGKVSAATAAGSAAIIATTAASAHLHVVHAVAELVERGLENLHRAVAARATQHGLFHSLQGAHRQVVHLVRAHLMHRLPLLPRAEPAHQLRLRVHDDGQVRPNGVEHAGLLAHLHHAPQLVQVPAVDPLRRQRDSGAASERHQRGAAAAREGGCMP